MPVDLGLGGAGFFGDFSHTDLGPQPVESTESGIDDFAAHLLTVFAPAFAARIDLYPGLRAGMESANSPHVRYLTVSHMLTCTD